MVRIATFGLALALVQGAPQDSDANAVDSPPVWLWSDASRRRGGGGSRRRGVPVGPTPMPSDSRRRRSVPVGPTPMPSDSRRRGSHRRRGSVPNETTAPPALAQWNKFVADETCEDFLGNMDGVFTVVDVDIGYSDVTKPYCDSAGMSVPCSYMHFAGLATTCLLPTPPDACHRYHKVRYSNCPELESFNGTGNVDTGAFNALGEFMQCADRVTSNEVNCYAPADEEGGRAVRCNCPATPRAPEAKDCQHYFGSFQDGAVTVVDTSVGTDTVTANAGYCDGNGLTSPCTYIHGSNQECEIPTTPGGCHHYHTVTYSSCPEMEGFNFDARIDDTNAFDKRGVFRACSDRVISRKVHCYGPPSRSPEECGCHKFGAEEAEDAISV